MVEGGKKNECYSHNDPHNTHSELRGKAGILPELQISLRNIYKVKWMSFIAWGCGCLLWGNEPKMICLFNLWNMWSCDHRSILNGVLMQWWGRKETGKSKALMKSLGKVKGDIIILYQEKACYIYPSNPVQKSKTNWHSTCKIMVGTLFIYNVTFFSSFFFFFLHLQENSRIVKHALNIKLTLMYFLRNKKQISSRVSGILIATQVGDYIILLGVYDAEISCSCY